MWKKIRTRLKAIFNNKDADRKNKKEKASTGSRNYLKIALNHKYLLVRDSIALILLALAFALVYRSLAWSGLVGQIILLCFGIFIILAALMLIYGFVHKTVDLKLSNYGLTKYSIFSSLNLIFAATIPVLLIAYISKYLVFLMRAIPKYNTWICDLRYDFIKFYWRNDIFELLLSIGSFLFYIAIIIFIASEIVAQIGKKG